MNCITAPALLLLAGFLATSASAQFRFSDPVHSPNALGNQSVATYIRVANLNGDAYPDLLVSDQLATMAAINQGPPSFGFTSALIPGIGGGRIYAADLDFDGDSDLIVSVHQPAEMQFLLNDGTGAFPGPIYRHVYSTATERTLEGIAAHNFDSDPDLELLVIKRINAPGAPFVHELWDVDFTVNPPTLVSRITWPNGGDSMEEGLAVADLDRDGDLDYWASNGGVYENDGTGNFSLVTILARSWRRDLAIGDLDGDGVLDLVQTINVQCCSEPSIVTYIGASSCTPQIEYREFQGAAPGATGYSPQVVDFDRDGRGEILVGVSGQVLIVPVSAAGAPSLASAYRLESPIIYGISLDVDQDGRPDYLSAWYGSIRVRFNQTETTNGAAEYIQEAEWPLPGVPPLAIWVDQQNPGTIPDGSCGAPFPTIGAALAVARNTDVVYVRPGRYNCTRGESSSFVLEQGVSLIGVGGPKLTSIEGIPVECQTGCVLAGFTLVNRGDMTSEAMITCSGAEIRGNVLLGYGAVNGIQVKNALPSRIVSNIVHFCSAGIEIDTTAGLPSAEIYYNTIVENREGIEYSEANTLRIVGNLIVKSNTYGIHHHCKGTFLNELLVDYNYVAGNRGGNFVTTVAFGQTSCHMPFPLVPGPHDQQAPSFDDTWFVDALGDDFHLSALATIRDEGDPVPDPLWLRTDVDGDPRSVRSSLSAPITGLVPDIGADEIAMGRLDLTSDGGSVTFVTRGLASGLFEAKLFGGAPGLFPLGSPLNSQLLLNPFAILFVTPAALPDANGEVAFTIVLPPEPCGARAFVQALVLDPGTLEGFLTNAVAYTTR